MAAAGAFFVTVLCINCGYNLRQVQIALTGTVPEVYIGIMQYPGLQPLPNLEVLPNFTVSQYIDF